MKVEVAVLDSPTLTSLTVSIDVKHHERRRRRRRRRAVKNAGAKAKNKSEPTYHVKAKVPYLLP